MASIGGYKRSTLVKHY